MISGRAKRVLVYTVSLLTAPIPVMPYVKGTREFALAMMACGAVLAASSLYVLQGELRLTARGLLGHKLVIAALGTLLLGTLALAYSIVSLVRG